MNNTCLDCVLWSDFDGLCWCASSPRYLQEVNGDIPPCDDFKKKVEQEEEHRHIHDLCRIKGELGRTGRYGVYFDLTGPEIEFWVEEFGKPDFLLHITHQDAGTVLDYVRKRCDELRLIEP